MKHSKLNFNLILFMLLNFISTSIFCFPKKMIISVPITDLRTKPQEASLSPELPILFKDNPMQDSQLLLNEQIIALEENDGWLKVQAIEQKKYLQDAGIDFQTGYIKSNHAKEVERFSVNNLIVNKQWSTVYKTPNEFSDKHFDISIGTKLCGEKLNKKWYLINLPDGTKGTILANDLNEISEIITLEELQDNLIKTALTFLNQSYCWGGRSGGKVDCSSFVNLTYRANGIDIARDANDQFKFSKKLLLGSQLKPGDLIFFSNTQRPYKINHVLIYLGDGLIIESTGKEPFKKTIITTDIERFEKPISNLIGDELYKVKYGSNCYDQHVYFGTYLSYTHYR